MNIPDDSRNWHDLGSPAQIEKLMSAFGNFHDACIRGIHVVTGHYVDWNLSMHVDWRTTVHMLIQRQFAELSAIELRFEEVLGLRLYSPPPGYEAIIYSAAFFLRDGVFYWADNPEWTPESSREISWVAARKASWRNASDRLGADLRYREQRTQP